MAIIIREERPEDRKFVFNVIKKAFESAEHSDQSEQFLVDRLRKSQAFIPELSLIAAINDKIIGHILLSKIEILNGLENFSSLALGPISVLPEFQQQGIGGRLINTAHIIARQMGFKSIVLVGHAKYYPRFGYVKASVFNIEVPFEAPDENCMALELIDGGHYLM